MLKNPYTMCNCDKQVSDDRQISLFKTTVLVFLTDPLSIEAFLNGIQHLHGEIEVVVFAKDINNFGFKALFILMAGLSLISFFGILFKPRKLL